MKALYIRMVLFFIGPAIRREIQESQTRKDEELAGLSVAAARDHRAFDAEFNRFIYARLASPFRVEVDAGQIRVEIDGAELAKGPEAILPLERDATGKLSVARSRRTDE